MRRILCLLLATLLSLSLVACAAGRGASTPTEGATTTEAPILPDPPAEPLPPADTADIHLQTIYLYIGDSYTLPYIRYTSGFTRPPVWAASTDCVTVTDGVVTAVKEGYAMVTAGGSTDCLVRVLPNTLPVLSIDTDGAAINSKETYTPCSIDVESESGDFDIDGESGGIRLRGNSSSRRPKVPYRIRFDSKRNILGLHNGEAYKSWVLLAEFNDDSYTRTALSLSLASVILTEYSSDWCFVNLYINDRFVGIYTLCEQSHINRGRIDIEEAGLESDSVESGYLFEFDGANPNTGKPYIRYDHYENLTVYPTGQKYAIAANDAGTYGKIFYELKNDGTSAKQKDYADDYFQAILDLIYYATYENTYYKIDPATAKLVKSDATSAEEAISAAVDMESAARSYLLSEIICNGDEYKKSFYLYVDFSQNGTGKLTFTCPWDFDGATVYWATYNHIPYNKYFAATENIFYVMLASNEFFRETAKEIWQELYASSNGFENVVDTVARLATVYEDDFEYEAALWYRENEQSVVAEKACKWLRMRIRWLHYQFSL